MRIRTLVACVLLAGASPVLVHGANSQLTAIEQELGNLKIEVFKLRMQLEESNARAESERKAAEEARVQNRRFQADLQELMRQLQEATRILNSRIGSAPVRATSTSRPTSSDAPEPVATSEDEKAFNAAVLDYNRGNYALAADSLGLFLKSNPQSPRRSDALFFLGLSHYNQKAYDKAQHTFEQIIKDHGASSQYLPAKLKRAQCMVKAGSKPAAIKAFKDIVESAPGTPEARTAEQELADLGF